MTFLLGIGYPTLGFIFADTRIVYKNLGLFRGPDEYYEDEHPKIQGSASGFIAGAGISGIIDLYARGFTEHDKEIGITELSEAIRKYADNPLIRFVTDFYKQPGTLLTLSTNYIVDRSGTRQLFIRLGWFSRDTDYLMAAYEDNSPVFVWPPDFPELEMEAVENGFKRKLEGIITCATGGKRIDWPDILNPVVELFSRISSVSRSVSPIFDFAGIQLTQETPYIHYLLGYYSASGGGNYAKVSVLNLGDERPMGRISRSIIENFEPVTIRLI
jgi:hypothetical protein